MQPSPNDDVRRQKEAQFHDQWAADVDLDATLIDETFTSTTAIENQFVLEQFGDVRGLRVLDYGCGAAEGGIYLAKQGAKVVAIDVSPGMLELAQRLAKKHGVEIETRVVSGDAIPAGDGEFDRIYGNGVLHHVPLSTAIPELARIMKPGGCAFLTVHGSWQFPREHLPRAEVRKFDSSGFYYYGGNQTDGLPEFYGSTYHSEQYIREHWSRFFYIELIIPRGVNNHQDIVVCRKR